MKQEKNNARNPEISFHFCKFLLKSGVFVTKKGCKKNEKNHFFSNIIALDVSSLVLL